MRGGGGGGVCQFRRAVDCENRLAYNAPDRYARGPARSERENNRVRVLAGDQTKISE